MSAVMEQFRRVCIAYSPSNWQGDNRDKFERGNQIIMPASALEELRNVELPITFQITRIKRDFFLDYVQWKSKKSHCTALAFTAPEGAVYIPTWMLRHLGLDPEGGDTVQLTRVSLSMATFIQFQCCDVFSIPEHVLQIMIRRGLRYYSCVTVGDIIEGEWDDYFNYGYRFEITEVRSAKHRNSEAALITSTEAAQIEIDVKPPNKARLKQSYFRNEQQPPNTRALRMNQMHRNDEIYGKYRNSQQKYREIQNKRNDLLTEREKIIREHKQQEQEIMSKLDKSQENYKAACDEWKSLEGKLETERNKAWEQNRELQRTNKKLKNRIIKITESNKSLQRRNDNVLASHASLQLKLEQTEEQYKELVNKMEEDDKATIVTDVNIGRECIVCMIHGRTNVFVPCGHLCVCDQCREEHYTETGLCPICRKKYKWVQKVYG